jgi:hypothetical protein
MFSPEHKIWKFADFHDELDDWLPYAEELVKKCSSQESIQFRTEFDIRLASYLLMDNLLPSAARTAYAEMVLKTMWEASEKKLNLEALHISAPEPGRKKSVEIWRRNRDMWSLLKQGRSRSSAYEEVAAKFFKSVDTVRRDFERSLNRAGRKDYLEKIEAANLKGRRPGKKK